MVQHDLHMIVDMEMVDAMYKHIGVIQMLQANI